VFGFIVFYFLFKNYNIDVPVLLHGLSKQIQQFILTAVFCDRPFTIASDAYGLMTAQNYLPVKN